MQEVLSWANSGLAIVVVLGLCLFFHEAGHFVVAKLCRMRVPEFCMGFGPALWRRRRGDTEYALRLFPIGGWVRIDGMEPGEVNGPDGFHSRPRWQRYAVVLAGVTMNVVLALLVYWCVNVFAGVPVSDSRAVMVRSVFDDTPAAAAGLRAGDRIVAVAGSASSAEIASVKPGSAGQRMGLKPGYRVFQVADQPVATPPDLVRLVRQHPGAKIWAMDQSATSIESAMVQLKAPNDAVLASLPTASLTDAQVAEALGVTFGELDQMAAQRAVAARPSEHVALTVLRDGARVELSLVPESLLNRLELVDDKGAFIAPHRMTGRMGIVLGGETRRAGVIEGFKMAGAEAVGSVLTVVMTLKAMLAQKVAAEPTGPIGIMAMTAETAKLGWGAVLGLCGMISANLAVINLMPFPPFDGFHVVLLSIEGVIRRRVDARLEVLVRVAGMVVILTLFVGLAFKDIVNLVSYGTY